MIKYPIILAALLSVSSLLQAAELKAFNSDQATPPLILQDLQGKTHDLNDYKGKVVLVQFWATYCAPCRQEMPTMDKMTKKMADVPFKILAIDMGESKAEVEKFVSEVKPEFTILLDESGDSISNWKIFAVPSNFIIDPQGKIRYTLFGGVDWADETLISKLKALAVTETAK
ncbi:MAG: TlpA disulfide reductase family protein [Gammaproteobacteria bacterium]|nr:TlpA disulfide reductase family protein [Gammaproteobacteria bacterium]